MKLEKTKNDIINNIDEIKKTYDGLENISNLLGEGVKKAHMQNQFFFQEMNDLITVERANRNDTKVKKQLKPITIRLSENTTQLLKSIDTGKKTMDEELLNLINLKSDYDDIKKGILGAKVWREIFSKKNRFSEKVKPLYEYLNILDEEYKLILDASLEIIENMVGCSSNNLFTNNSIDRIIPLVDLLLKVESNAKSCGELSPADTNPVFDLVEIMINRINIIIENLKNEVPVLRKEKIIVCRLSLQTLDTLENYKDEETKDLIMKLRELDYSEISDLEF